MKELGLSAEPAAAAAARLSVESSGMLLFGEVHGVAENPLLIRELVALLGLRWVALEWPGQLTETVETFRRGGALVDHPLLGVGDGRVTAGHLAVLRALASETPEVEWFGFDTEPMPAGGPDESLWAARDRLMAQTVLELMPSGGGLVVAGNVHTLLRPTANGIPMGARGQLS